MNKEILREIGLNASEIEVYLDLVKHPDSLASEIAKRIQISRTYIYDSIKNLIAKGLITYVIKNNRKYFKALELKKLLEYLDEKAIHLQNQKKQVKELISELNSFKKPKQEKPVVEVLEGEEGLKTVLNDIVRTGKQAVGWGHTTKIRDHIPEWFLERYLKERDKKKINVKQLYAGEGKRLISKRTKFKKLPEEFSSPVTFGAYGDKVIIFFWSETPIVIRIRKKEIAESFEKHFDFLWKKIKG